MQFIIFLGSLGVLSSLPYSSETDALFSDPHVFITLSSMAVVSDGVIRDTQIELNWYGWKWELGDTVNLYNINPQQTTNQVLPVETVLLANATIAKHGTHRTSVRFGHPSLTSSDDSDNCLGYWIAYVRYETVLKLNCFRKYPRWMKNLKNIIGDTPLSSLMIPGTHDAGAIREYDYDSENSTVRFFVTQEEKLYHQLVYGIRYLDIRVAHYPLTQEKFWINHDTVRFQPLSSLFSAVRRFSSETGEIIFMDFHRFPIGFENASTNVDLLNFVEKEVGYHLVRKVHISSADPTPNQVWATGRNVILTYQDDRVSNSNDFLWPYLIHAWGNKNNIDEMKTYFEREALPAFGCSHKWWSSMAELTPTKEQLDRKLTPDLREMAQTVNLPITYWWMKPSWYSRSMIVSTDFFLGNNIIEMAVLVNRNRGTCPQNYEKESRHDAPCSVQRYISSILLVIYGILFVILSFSHVGCY